MDGSSKSLCAGRDCIQTERVDGSSKSLCARPDCQGECKW